MNRFLKLLCSFPIILFFLYYIPFLGVCLILLRLCIIRYSIINIPLSLIIIGIIILIPKILEYIMINFKIDIPYLDKILNNNIYLILLSKVKLLFIIGIIMMIISFLIKEIFNKGTNLINKYITEEVNKTKDIEEKNNLIMQEKREKAKNTHVVKCPYCGHSNMLTSKNGTCTYCRKNIE